MPTETTRQEHEERSIGDREYVRSVCESGDEAAFFALVGSLEREALTYLRRYLGNDADANDVLQATNVNVLNAFRRGTFDATKSLRPWYYTVATRAAIDWQRRARRHASAVRLDAVRSVGEEGGEGTMLNLLAVDDDPAERVAVDDACETMRSHLAELSPELRDVVRLVYFEGAKYREAAAMLRIPEGTVKSRLHATLVKLREAFEGKARAA